MPLPRRFLVAAALVLTCEAASAETDSICPRPSSLTPDALSAAGADPSAPVEVRARSVRTTPGGVTELEGLVELVRGAERLDADHLRYDPTTKTLNADGQVQFRNALGDRVQTEWFRFQLDARTGEAGPSHYNLRNDLARGDAARIEFRGPDHTRLTDLSYTTCRPGQDDWFLRIGRLDLDSKEEIGTARHATVDVFGIPVFYFPYLNFSIADQRKSGFLFPSVGHSDKLGYEIAAPYYFNLAPNYDATVNPRILTKRGLQLENQFRYLSHDASGTLHVDVLPNDQAAEDEGLTDDDRALGAWRHLHTFSPLWSADIDLRRVSDADYFDDFGDRLSLTSQSHVPQSANLAYRGPAWTFDARFADYQTIDLSIGAVNEPYARLPQLRLASASQPLPNQFHPQLEAEWTHFAHQARLDGERLNLNTGLSLPLQNAWGFLTPKLGARYIGYRLNREDDESPALARGVFSLDSGVVFEREASLGGRAMVQTLEPRLFYLWIPPKNQDALPNFDSGVPDLSFAALFRDNRFNGGDRIGDANQFTAAISTRFLDVDQGVERLRLSLGRIFYIDDREVNLPAGVQTAATSDIVAEASAWLVGNWHARETLQWSTENDRVERSNFYLQYQPARNKIFSLGEVFVRDQLGQVDLGAEWPVSGRWSVRARSLYSTRDDRNLESYFGIEYNACCWALRVTAARRWQDPDQINSYLVELQLNGLSRIGRVPESPLKQGLFFPYADEQRNRLFE